MHIELLQHVPYEGPGLIAQWAEDRSHILHRVALYRGHVPLKLDEIDMVIIMGGPMSVADERDYPWLHIEKRHLRDALKAGMPMLGICLGAQLLACVLGGSVTHNREKEIGWFPVERLAPSSPSWLHRLFPPRYEVFHWHGETFSLPEHAEHLARSTACENQAFVCRDRVVGLQFHLEMQPEGVREIIAHNRKDLESAGAWVQDPQTMLQKPIDPLNRVILFGLLDGLADQAAAGPPCDT